LDLQFREVQWTQAQLSYLQGLVGKKAQPRELADCAPRSHADLARGPVRSRSPGIWVLPGR